MNNQTTGTSRWPCLIQTGGLLFIAMLTVLLYYEVLPAPKVFDTLYHLNDSLMNAFQWSSFLGLRWFSTLTLALTYHFVQDEPFWHRTINVIIHVLNAGVLFLFLKKLFTVTLKDHSIGSVQITWYALLGSLMFAVNPIAVYATAYIIQRGMLLATFFALLSCCTYLKGIGTGRRSWYLITALLYFLSVDSKEHAVMVPGVYLALTLLLKKPSRELLKEIFLPFCLYTAVAIFIALKQKNIIGGVFEPLTHDLFRQEGLSTENIPDFATMSEAKIYTLSIINQGFLFFKYLFLWFIPYLPWISINIASPFPTEIISWPFTVGFMAYGLYPVLALSLIRRQGYSGLLGFALISPWVLFLTEFSLVRFHENMVLYRSYLWIVGCYAALPPLLHRLPKYLQVGIAITACLTIGLIAHDRVGTFKSPLLVWQDAVEKIRLDPEKSYPLSVYRSYSNLATYYSVSENFPEAIKYYNKALAIYPQRYQALHALSDIHARLKNYTIAFQYIYRVIEINPEYAEGYYSLARIFADTNNKAAAIENYHKALGLKYDYPAAHYNLANEYSQIGDTVNAIKHYLEAMRFNPKDPDPVYNLGNTYYTAGQYPEAIAAYQKVVNIDPRYLRAYHNLGAAYLRVRESQKAMEAFNKVLQIDPNYELTKKYLEKLQGKKIIRQ